MATGEPLGFGSVVSDTSSSSLIGALNGLGAAGNVAGAQSYGIFNQGYNAYQSALNPFTTYVSTGTNVYGITATGTNFIIDEVKKKAKKAFAALMDEITEWHGDVLAV